LAKKYLRISEISRSVGNRYPIRFSLVVICWEGVRL